MEKVSEEYEKFLNWCEDKWVLDYKWKKLLSKLSNSDKDFLRDQYETSLKDDMVAILEDLKKEMNPIKECEHQIYGKEEWNFVGKCQDVIQQKINKLKEIKNEIYGNS